MSELTATLLILTALAVVWLVPLTIWMSVELVQTRATVRQLARAHILANRYDKWGGSFGFEHDHDDQKLIAGEPIGHSFGAYTHGGGESPVREGGRWKYEPADPAR